MIDNTENNVGHMEFISQLKKRAEQKVAECYQLMHEQKRIGLQLERTKTYIGRLNDFLEAEGQAVVTLREAQSESRVGKPGNRSKDFPLRKTEWEGMALRDIVKAILDATPREIHHANDIARKIYEIQTDSDLRKVKRGLVSTLRRETKNGLWEGHKGNRYKAKASAEQGRLIST